MTPDLSALQSLLGVSFRDSDLLYHALVHRSFLNENRKENLTSNERLEFLGDAVLELWATHKLFQIFTNLPEGDLTNLRSLIVCTESLAKVATSIGLGNYLLLSRGEESHGGRQNQSILADTFESIIGALYLDQGQAVTDEFLHRHLNPVVDAVSHQKVFKDPKSLFQEIAQSKRGITPHYVTIKETGPDHQKQFEVAVFIATDQIATGTGASKQKAEEAAAIAATSKLS